MMEKSTFTFLKGDRKINIQKLFIENQLNPLGMDNKHPGFTWSWMVKMKKSKAVAKAASSTVSLFYDPSR